MNHELRNAVDTARRHARIFDVIRWFFAMVAVLGMVIVLMAGVPGVSVVVVGIVGEWATRWMAKDLRRQADGYEGRV